MNAWQFTGNLGKDAEQRFIPSGESIVSFSVAVKAGFGKNESTSWVRCNLWGKRGESVLPYLKKGAQVGISGEASLREYEKDGATKSSLEVRVNDVTLLGGKAQGSGQAPAQPARTNEGSSFDDLEDNIPF